MGIGITKCNKPGRPESITGYRLQQVVFVRRVFGDGIAMGPHQPGVGARFGRANQSKTSFNTRTHRTR